MFVFINHAAKAADYIRNNHCDILNAFKKKKKKERENEKWRFSPATRDGYPRSAHRPNDRRDFICQGSQLHF